MKEKLNKEILEKVLKEMEKQLKELNNFIEGGNLFNIAYSNNNNIVVIIEELHGETFLYGIDAIEEYFNDTLTFQNRFFIQKPITKLKLLSNFLYNYTNVKTNYIENILYNEDNEENEFNLTKIKQKILEKENSKI